MRNWKWNDGVAKFYTEKFRLYLSCVSREMMNRKCNFDIQYMG